MEIKLKKSVEGNRRVITSHNGNHMIFKGVWTEVSNSLVNKINPEIYDIRGAPEAPKTIPKPEKVETTEIKETPEIKKSSFKLKTK